MASTLSSHRHQDWLRGEGQKLLVLPRPGLVEGVCANGMGIDL